MRITWTCSLALLMALAPVSCKKDGGKKKVKTAGVDDLKAPLPPPSGETEVPWDCGEVAERLGWTKGQVDYDHTKNWCEQEASRGPAKVFAEVAAENGTWIQCAKILARLGEPKGVQRYHDLLYKCIDPDVKGKVECAMKAADNAAIVECGWLEYKIMYRNLFTNETKLKEKYQALADEIEAEANDAGVTDGAAGKDGKKK